MHGWDMAPTEPLQIVGRVFELVAGPRGSTTGLCRAHTRKPVAIGWARWLRFLAADGSVVLTGSELGALQVTASRWTNAEVADARHLEELLERDPCLVWIDATHSGVGSGACGPDVLAHHRVRPGHYWWSHRLR